MQSLATCYFCNKNFPENQIHGCVIKAYSLLNTLVKEKKDPTKIFNNIDNVVLEGGGIKGISYLGALQEILKENPSFLKNIKRVAGNSAGSIAALYIALNLDPYTDMAELMSRKYLDLLDEGLALKVIVNTNIIASDDFKIFRAKDIFLAAINMLEELQNILKIPSRAQEAHTLIHSVSKNIIKYFSYKYGVGYRIVMRAGAGRLAEKAARMIISMLAPQLEENLVSQKKPNKNKKVAKPKNDVPQPNQEQVNKVEEENKQGFKEVLKKAFRKAVKESEEEEEKIIEKETNTNAEMPKSSFLKGLFSKKPEIKQLKEENETPNSKSKKETQFYRDQKDNPLMVISDKSELIGEVLHFALAELVWFIFVSQSGANGLKEELGLFSGDIVKQELIENAIKKAFSNLNRLDEYKPELTFKELYDFADKRGNRIFKPFFATSFNIANHRTEVFSVYHTPNAVVSDAIRASMSIPVFFTPVTIRENGEPRKIYCNDGKDCEAIRYMDGGVLDNYPIWIFDDLKYCIENIPEWIPKKKNFIQNPRTLGFRLLDSRDIDIYTNPYYDKKRSKMKRVGEGSYQGSFKNIAGSFFSANMNKHEENEHIYRGDCPRSIYVDNLGINSVAFSLSETDQARLIQSGRQAIIDYKKRAQTNFLGEGENYY